MEFPDILLKNREWSRLVHSTLDAILTLRSKSGNYPFSTLNMHVENPIVQFCHGAPGIAILFTRAYQLFKSVKYLDAAKEACDFVWKHGLITKENCICHGIVGNAYAFLYLYKIDPV